MVRKQKTEGSNVVRIKVYHQDCDWLYGTLNSIKTKDKGALFVLNVDDGWIIIEQPTLSELVTEAERLGFSRVVSII